MVQQPKEVGSFNDGVIRVEGQGLGNVWDQRTDRKMDSDGDTGRVL